MQALCTDIICQIYNSNIIRIIMATFNQNGLLTSPLIVEQLHTNLTQAQVIGIVIGWILGAVIIYLIGLFIIYKFVKNGSINEESNSSNKDKLKKGAQGTGTGHPRRKQIMQDNPTMQMMQMTQPNEKYRNQISLNFQKQLFVQDTQSQNTKMQRQPFE